VTENPIQPPGEVPSEAALAPGALIQPCDVVPSTGIASGPMGNYVVDRYETPVGSIMILLTPEQAKKHGEDLIQRAARTSTGLVLPPGTIL
jgi:hypothetical protein